jgi:hypothetical protein
MYKIPQGTVLYRGFPEVEGRVPRRGQAFYFLTTHRESAESYGVVFPVTTDRPYHLVALDDAPTRARLYDEAPKYIQRILDDNYSLQGRDSVFAADVKLSKYLCGKGFDGYGLRKMANRDESRADFHDELMFCDTSKMIIGDTSSNDEDIVQIVNRMKDKANARELRQARKSLKTQKKSPKLLPTKLFEGGSRRRRR